MNRRNYTLLLGLLIMITGIVSGQTVTITGPTAVNIGETLDYSVNIGISPVSYSWKAFGGVVQESTSESAIILWTEFISGNKVTYFAQDEFGQSYLGALKVTMPVPAPNTTFSITQNCGSTAVTRDTNPSSALDWFWQTSSS